MKVVLVEKVKTFKQKRTKICLNWELLTALGTHLIFNAKDSIKRMNWMLEVWKSSNNTLPKALSLKEANTFKLLQIQSSLFWRIWKHSGQQSKYVEVIPTETETQRLDYCLTEMYHLCKVHPGAPARPSWRRPGGPGRRSADSGCSVGVAPSAAAPCRQRGAASGTAGPPRCAQTPAPGRCRRYLPGSSGTPPPGGDRELGERIQAG